MKVVGKNDVATDDPRIRRSPCAAKELSRFIVREQGSPSLCANCEEDNHRAEAGFDGGKMGGVFPLGMIGWRL